MNGTNIFLDTNIVFNLWRWNIGRTPLIIINQSILHFKIRTSGIQGYFSRWNSPHISAKIAAPQVEKLIWFLINECSVSLGGEDWHSWQECQSCSVGYAGFKSIGVKVTCLYNHSSKPACSRSYF